MPDHSKNHGLPWIVVTCQCLGVLPKESILQFSSWAGSRAGDTPYFVRPLNNKPQRGSRNALAEQQNRH